MRTGQRHGDDEANHFQRPAGQCHTAQLPSISDSGGRGRVNAGAAVARRIRQVRSAWVQLQQLGRPVPALTLGTNL